MMKLLLIALLSTFLIACVETSTIKKSSPRYSHSPPPHAPAHGYRHKHKKQNLIFDTGVGVYVVVGLLDHYFHNDRYYRYRKGIWETTKTLEGLWRKTTEHDLPVKLYQSKAGKSHPGKGRGKGRGKDKKHRGD